MLRDDRADLVRAHVEADDVAILLLGQDQPPSLCSGGAASPPTPLAARDEPASLAAVAAAGAASLVPLVTPATVRGFLFSAAGWEGGGTRLGRSGDGLRLLGEDAAAEAQVEVLGAGGFLGELAAQAQERHEPRPVGRLARTAAPRPPRAAPRAGRRTARRTPRRSRCRGRRGRRAAPRRAARGRGASPPRRPSGRARSAGRRPRCAGRRCRSGRRPGPSGTAGRARRARAARARGSATRTRVGQRARDGRVGHPGRGRAAAP